jgi:hypothetical protein
MTTGSTASSCRCAAAIAGEPGVGMACVLYGNFSDSTVP